MSWSRLATGLSSQAAGGGLESIITPQLTAIGYGSWSISPIKIVPPPTLMELFHKNWLPFENFKSGMAAHGCQVNMNSRRVHELAWGGARYVTKAVPSETGWTPWDLAQTSVEWTPPLILAMEIWNRDWVDNDTFQYWLKQMGITDPEMVRILRTMTAQIPPVQDLIRFNVREVFDEQIRKDQQLDADIKDDSPYWAWASAQGLRSVKIPDGKGGFLERDFAKDYWAAHWEHISPTQAYDMYHRLRPNRIERLPKDLQNTKPFLIDDLKQLLRIKDYAPGWRDRLAAISFRPIGRQDARRIFRAKLINPGEMKEVMMDFGYSPADAGRLVEAEEFALNNQIGTPQLVVMLKRKLLTEQEFRREMGLRGFGQRDLDRLVKAAIRLPTPGQIVRWYRKGIIDRDAAVASLRQLGFDDIDAKLYIGEVDRDKRLKATGPKVPQLLEAWRLGVLDEDAVRLALINVGYTGDEVTKFIRDEELTQKIELARAAQKRIRRQYLTGMITDQVALAMVRALGVAQADAVRIVQRWTSELGMARKELSAQQAIDAVKRGIISVPEARRRLQNLGYDDRTADILLLAGEQDRQQAVGRARIAAARTAKEQEQAALATIRRAEQQREKARRQLATHGSPAILSRWHKKRLISPREVEVRLRELGWPQPDIDRLIEESKPNEPQTSQEPETPAPAAAQQEEAREAP